jgi:hypothetical protein
VALSGLLVIGSVLEHRGSRANGAYASPVQVMNTPASAVPASPAMPGQPYSVEIFNGGVGAQNQAFGPGTGNLYGITSLTFSNFDVGTSVVRVFQPVLSGGTAGNCNGAGVIGGGQGVRVSVPSGQSVHLTFPTPVVFQTNNSQNCAAVTFQNANGTQYVFANGFSQ